MNFVPEDESRADVSRMAARSVILLVEGTHSKGTVLRTLLQSVDVELLCAPSASEALALLLQREVALAIVDVSMPESAGIDFAQLLRRRESTRQVPIITITAGSQNEEQLFVGNEAGTVEILRQPFEPDVLRRRVQAILDATRPEQAPLRQRDALQAAGDERQDVQAQLRMSEERYRLALAATRDTVWVWDLGTDSQVWNQAGADLFGWTEIVEHPQSAQWWVDRVHPEDRDRVASAFYAAVQDASAVRWEDEYRFQKRDGSYAWVLDRGYIVRDEQGAALRAIGAMQDITMRRQAEGVAAHLAAVVDSSFDAIITKTLDGVITSWNAAAERIFGYSAAEMVGHSLRRLIPADMPDEESRILDGISRGETLHHYETVRLTKDGRRLDLFLTISPITDPQGRVIGSSHIARDITEQKRQRIALKESEELFRALVDQMSQLAWMMDDRGRVYWVNQRWTDYTGMTSETMQDGSWDQVHHPDHLARVLSGKRRSLETGEPWEETCLLRGKNGRFRWYLTRAVPIRDDEGRIVRWFGTNTDITEHKRIEEDLRTAEQALRESETRFRELVERSPFGIYVVDAEFRIAHMNEAGQKGAFCHVRPVIRRDLGEVMRILWPEPVAADILERFRHTLATGIPYRSRDFINPRADIEQTEGYEWELHRLTLPDGRHGVICYYYDSTRLRQVEAALRESAERLRSAMTAGGMGAWDIDLTTDVITWDAQQYHIFGLSPEAPSPLTRDTFFTLVHPADRQQVQCAAAEAERSGRFVSEFRIVRPDGGVRWVAGHGAVVEHAGTPRARMVGINYDVTERKRQEFLSAEQKQLLELIATNRPIRECLSALTAAVTRLEPNARAALLVADSARAKIADTFSTRVPPSFGSAIQGAPICELPVCTCVTAIYTGAPVTCSDVETEGPWSAEWRALCLSHDIKACHSQPVYGQDGTAIASFLITLGEAREPNDWERRLAEFGAHLAGLVLDRDRIAKALRESQDRLQAAAADLEKRVEARTHELMRSQAELRALASELNLTEQRERKRLAGELHDHLQQMLVFGKLQLGRGMLKTGVDPECMEIIRDVHGMLSEALTYTHTLVAELCPPVLREHGLVAGLRWLADYMKRYGMRVMVTLPDEEDLPLPEDWTILLFQSVRELLMNAHKYAGTGVADVALRYGQGELIIHVQDRGKGFDSAGAASADFTVGGSSSKFGLFSIKERMRTLGGGFAIVSAPGKGTTATLRLPLTSPAAGAARVSAGGEALAGMPAVWENPVGARSIRVLLVDDHVMIRQGLRAVLEAYSDVELVGEAGNGEEAIALTDRLQPSVVVMDISMPKMNGIEATLQITTRHPEVAVIGLSVNAGGDNQAAMLKAGARQLLTKEAAVEQLYGAIKRAVGLST